MYERRPDGRAGLAHLMFLADVAAIDGRAAGADGAADGPGQIVNQLEVVLAADAAAAGHDHPRALEVHLPRLDVPLDQLQGQIAGVDLDLFLDDPPVAIGRRPSGHHALADRGHLRPLVVVDDRGDDVAAEGRANLQEQVLVQRLRPSGRPRR